MEKDLIAIELNEAVGVEIYIFAIPDGKNVIYSDYKKYDVEKMKSGQNVPTTYFIPADFTVVIQYQTQDDSKLAKWKAYGGFVRYIKFKSWV